MRFLPFLFLSALLTLTQTALSAAEASRAHVRALLVLASDQSKPSDPRLSAYEPTLRRILRFESYKLAGEGSANLGIPGSADIALGQGHSLSVESEKPDGRGLRLRVNWQDGGRSLMNTGLSLRPGVPAVLGGPASGTPGEVWAVLLVAD